MVATRARKREKSFLIIICDLQLIIRDEQFVGKGSEKIANVQEKFAIVQIFLV